MFQVWETFTYVWMKKNDVLFSSEIPALKNVLNKFVHNILKSIFSHGGLWQNYLLKLFNSYQKHQIKVAWHDTLSVNTELKSSRDYKNV